WMDCIRTTCSVLFAARAAAASEARMALAAAPPRRRAARTLRMPSNRMRPGVPWKSPVKADWIVWPEPRIVAGPAGEGGAGAELPEARAAEGGGGNGERDPAGTATGMFVFRALVIWAPRRWSGCPRSLPDRPRVGHPGRP